MPSFQSIRDVPQAGVPQWEADMLNQVKENLELLMGVRTSGIRAVTSDSVTVVQADNVTMRVPTAQRVAYNISGYIVADGNEFSKLISNVQELANNVVSLQLQVNTLVRDLTNK